MTAPWLSLTTPEIEPVVLWANAAPVSEPVNQNAKLRTGRLFRISFSSILMDKELSTTGMFCL
jgi:hypothetical protein